MNVFRYKQREIARGSTAKAVIVGSKAGGGRVGPCGPTVPGGVPGGPNDPGGPNGGPMGEIKDIRVHSLFKVG
jgi:hypothetical protein